MEVLSRHCSSRNSEAKFSPLLLSWSVARRICRLNRVMTGLCDLASEKSMCANADVGEVRVLRVGKSTTVVSILSVVSDVCRV